MADKTVKELAQMVQKPVEKLLEQLADAGLPQRTAESLVSDSEQEHLVAHLQRSHGQQAPDRKITLTRKTTSTAKVASTGGKTKSINVEVRKRQTFVKPDPASIAADARAKADAEAKARADMISRQKAESEAREQARLAAEAHDKAMREAAAAAPAAKQQVASKKDAPVKKRVVKEESAEQKQAREAEIARLKTAEEAARRAAAEAAQQRTLEQMRQMATKYASGEAVVERKIDETAPLARGLVGRAYEESFDKENREIKRGVATTPNSRGGKSRSGGRKGQEEQRIRPSHKGLKTSQANQHGFEKPVEKQVYDVQIGENIVVADLAQKMAVKAREVIRMLMKMGEMVREDQPIDQATAALVVEELGHNPILVSDTAVEDNLVEAAGRERGDAKPRPPVVTIMGHVDHGKTSLLDYIRRTKVASGEAGGITQHIGAYHVETDKGVITFLDTPGHAAFTAMRARGAKATDIVVIVVAADDGVMPQTAEAIDHARAAGTPMIIAINKMDKESADIDRVLNELAVKGITTEIWNGDVPAAKISAKTGMGVDELLDLISIQAELMELTASDEGAAQGVVIEARIDKGRGAVASLLVQKGTLKAGDLILAGAFYGRVRAMNDENGQSIKSAGPSIPVEILGLPDAPNAGDEFLVVSDEKKAREVAEFRGVRERDAKLNRQNGMRLENIMASMGKKDIPSVNIVLKTDVRGSLEALTNALNDLSVDDVHVRIVGSGVGAITESDVSLAESTGAVLLGFNVRADNAARLKCQQDDVDLRYYSIIYEMIDDVKAAMSGMLAPEHRENILGIAQVRQVFRSSRFGAAAGCMVMEGTIYRNKPIRVLRDDVVVFQGELESLRRHKDDVNEVRAGIECGLAVKGYNDIKELDKIEVYEVQEIKRTL